MLTECPGYQLRQYALSGDIPAKLIAINEYLKTRCSSLMNHIDPDRGSQIKGAIQTGGTSSPLSYQAMHVPHYEWNAGILTISAPEGVVDRRSLGMGFFGHFWSIMEAAITSVGGRPLNPGKR